MRGEPPKCRRMGGLFADQPCTQAGTRCGAREGREGPTPARAPGPVPKQLWVLWVPNNAPKTPKMVHYWPEIQTEGRALFIPSLTALSLGEIPPRLFLGKTAELGGRSQLPRQPWDGAERGQSSLWATVTGHPVQTGPLMTRSLLSPLAHWGLSFTVPPELGAEPRRPWPAEESRAFGDGSACLLPPAPQAARDRRCACGLPDQEPPTGTAPPPVPISFPSGQLTHP